MLASNGVFYEQAQILIIFKLYSFFINTPISINNFQEGLKNAKQSKAFAQVINTDECIDCGVCEPECPVGAIKPDTIHNADFWIQLNQKYAEVWPNILVKGDPLPKADIWADNKNKLSLLSEKAAS